MNKLRPFVIEDFDLKKPFASFLPGVAGKMGIPIWTYYVNRGQGLATFGLKDKNGSILEFNPASIAYEKIATNGFRTFIKLNSKVHEPFAIRTDKIIKRQMAITGASFTISETNHVGNYEIEIEYFGLPNAPLGALIRRVRITNIGDLTEEFEVLDGITHLMPRGITNGAYKDVGNLMRSWMEVKHLSDRVPYFTMRSSSGDEAEMHEMEDGNFFLAKDENDVLLKPIVDANVIFGHDVSKHLPVEFFNNPIEKLYDKEQYPTNKVPCAFVGVKKTLKPGQAIVIDMMIGMAAKYSLITDYLPEMLKRDFFDKKAGENDAIIKELTDDVATVTNNEVFDEYIRQSYLDNLLRGGYPVNLGTKEVPHVYYLYSRKHGDLERDYNWFNLEPEYYSQGNGNFRDVNQNRRNDILFHDYVGTANIKLFMNLIQMDGYNPLVINGSLFELKDKNKTMELMNQIVKGSNEKLKQLLSGSFSPGAIINLIVNDKIDTAMSLEDILRTVLDQSIESHEAVFGEGYWTDHFTYNLDLIESYLLVYPDRLEQLLLHDNTYKYYQSPVEILPRTKKYGLTKKNSVRQYGSTAKWTNSETAKLQMKEWRSNWHKITNGTVYETNLLTKLFGLAVVKFATLDPLGYGISMEANKPGWNDAMNGLPGLMGSAVPEAIELFRLINFIIEACTKIKKEKTYIYCELKTLISQIENNLTLLGQNKMTQFEYWDQTTCALETYRTEVRLTISGDETDVNILQVMSLMKTYLQKRLEHLCKEYPLIPTYMTYNATSYQTHFEGEKPLVTPYGLTSVDVKAFEARPLPPFLEAPARMLKIASSLSGYDLDQRYATIKESGIFDQKLQMYKTSDDLDGETIEIGRIRAFTKGWLERESNFMHMTFKYLYGLLKSGQYDRFFEDLHTNMPAFLDPEVYGRSIYENSSFIATSNNPDPEVHGQGFVSRLSGSNTEVLSMWFEMMFGHKPFYLDQNTLCLSIKPILPKSLFKDGLIQTRLLGSINVSIYNLSGLNTYDPRVHVKGYELLNHKDKKIVSGPVITGQDAIDVRDKKYTHIIVTLG